MLIHWRTSLTPYVNKQAWFLFCMFCTFLVFYVEKYSLVLDLAATMWFQMVICVDVIHAICIMLCQIKGKVYALNGGTSACGFFMSQFDDLFFLQGSSCIKSNWRGRRWRVSQRWRRRTFWEYTIGGTTLL